jgi:tetratricopeptide (TPR) repeat protein
MVRALFVAFCVTFLAVAGVFVFPLFASPPVAAVGSAPLNLPTRGHLVSLLKAGQYVELDGVLTELQERYEAGRIREGYLTYAFESFGRVDPAMAVQLENWRKTYPDSFAPQLALGLYSLKQAWAIRGEKIGILTNLEQFKAMERFLDESNKAMWGAIEKRPKLPIAWATLITTEMGVGDRRAIDTIYDSARRHVPDSSILHHRYHYALSPKWGGSAIFQFALRLELRRRYANDPAYRWVQFYTDKERIDEILFRPPLPWFSQILLKFGANAMAQGLSDFIDAAKKKMFDEESQEKPAAEALRIIDRILPYWDDAWLRKRRGDALYALERTDEVISEYAKAIEMSPDWVEARVGMTRILGLHNRYRDAHEHWRAAIEVDPYDPDLIVKYATFLSGIHEREQAGKQLEKALVYGAHDDDVRVQIGRLYWVLGLNDHALAEIRKATELVPENAENWYFFGLALERTKSCDAINAYKTYLKLCQQWGCPAREKWVVRNEIKNITDGCD